MAPFVHHPQPGHTGEERVGARTVAFRDGVAEVSVPSLLGRYTRLGYVVTDASGHDVAQPPRSGAGSSVEAWQNYARPRAQDDDERALVDTLSRDELIARYGAPVTDPVPTAR